MRNKIIIFLSLILLFAFGLRFWQVDKFPAGLNADEASYGYNAYSLISTGKDEHGESWPIHLKSFADYKPAGTAYIILPFVKLLGLSVKTIRFPSALAGAASVLLVFLLVRELFSSSRLALLASFFLAISPWHLHFSRGAWETNLGTTFMLLGIWLFFKGLKNAKYFPLSIINFAFSMYIYHTPRVVIPLFGFFLVVFYRKQVFKNLRWLVITTVIGGLLITPLLLSFLGPAGSARFSGLSMFSDIGPLWLVNRARGEHPNPTSLGAILLHNRPLVYGLKFFENYSDHFDGVFLFVTGDRVKRSNPPNMGELHLFDLFFLMAGFYFLFRKRPKNWPFPLAWLFLAPIPAALTFQTPSALRAHNMVIPLIIISSYGFYNLLINIKKKFSSNLLVTCYLLLVAIIFWNTAYYLHQYLVHYPKAYPEAWEYGYEELVSYLWPIRNDYAKVYVTEQYDQPYIIFLFYLKYPPEKFQQEVKLTPRDKFGFSTVREFDNFHFEFIDWKELRGKGNILYCGTDEEIPEKVENIDVVKEIYFLNGEVAFQCAKTKK
jgi:4-amino-4-deoxy-L-arabinose transferase-like glycosyltransferase